MGIKEAPSAAHVDVFACYCFALALLAHHDAISLIGLEQVLHQYQNDTANISWLRDMNVQSTSIMYIIIHTPRKT
jgi:hypothetical protein